MAYNYKNAIDAVFSYFNFDKSEVEFIDNTNNRAFIMKVNNEKVVIFTVPIGCKKDNRQNWVDTRDSGVQERKIAWKFAASNNFKFFFLCVNSEQERYKNYFFSIENTDEKISGVSFRSKEGNEGTGTQANIPNDFIPDKPFERFCTNRGFWFACIRKEFILEYLKYFDNRPYDDNLNEDVNVENTNLTNIENCGFNKIYYGIPGCGKSYYIENTVLGGVDKKNNVFRTTFYLDYSNSDFIGQIYPVVDGDRVKYEPIPGPFTKALERALTNKDEMIYLVVEEINRGNAAAIFGDTFQLLDRLKENKNGRVIGDSEYPISNAFIEDYLRKQDVEFVPGNIYIPHNLTLLATMNTSDQNVFPLDTAFKRRWNREKVTSDWGEENKIKGLYIPYTSVTWETFVKTINKEMIDKSAKEDAPISEDKQMGAYFADKSMLSKNPNDKDGDKIDSFANNVLDYLFNDVTKFNHKILFEEQILTTDKIYERIDMYKKAVLKESNNVGAEQVESKNIFSEIFTKDISTELVGNAKKVDDNND